jgi:glycine/D-amino acid oxidase-like deaminating enzyme
MAPTAATKGPGSRRIHSWGVPPWAVDFVPKQLALPERVDFAIVGGGFSGLSAAAWLRRFAPERSVLVLEAGSLGEGASGRTGGMVLAETAAGDLPGLGDVLAGYKEIVRELGIDARLELPGVWELARTNGAKNSPISWSDSGELKGVRVVAGGTVDPGMVVAGLARTAENGGAQIMENAEVQGLDFSRLVRLNVRQMLGGRVHRKKIHAEQVLLTTNAYSLELSGLRIAAEAKLTFALASEPLTAAQIEAIGLGSRQPFYTIDFPYLWGRLLESDAAIFGAGLVPAPTNWPIRLRRGKQSVKRGAKGLLRYDVTRGAAVERLELLEDRVRHLHPELASVRITHRWGGPILLTEEMMPIFCQHPRSKQVTVLGGYNGHGVALSVYLGKWAAEALLQRRALPIWR